MNIINKKLHSLLGIVSILILMFNCRPSNKEIQFEKLDFNSLFNYFLVNQDTTLENKIVCILQDSLNPDCERRIEIDSDSSFGIICKLINQNHFDGCIDIKERNVFIIHIKSNDSVTIKGKPYYDQDSLNKLLNEFILNPNNEPELPTKEIKEIDLIGNAEITKHAIIIYTQPLVDSVRCSTNWLSLKLTINQVLSNYRALRNNMAIHMLGKEFNKLNDREKRAICKLIPIRIRIHLNSDWNFYPPPPPPPPYVHDYFIEEDYDIEIDTVLMI